MSDLERRIAAALTNNDMKSGEIEVVIVETERAIAGAEAAVEVERKKALDLVSSPNADGARESVACVEFAQQRLRAVLPRLRRHYQQRAEAEEAARWRPRQQAAKAKRDELASRLRETYGDFCNTFVSLLDEIAEVDREIVAINFNAPPGAGLYLDKVANSAGADDYFLQNLELPGFGRGAGPVWPKPWR
jgi:hypothetical protein